MVPGQRPEPPEGLSPEEAAEWRAIVARMPSDWFTRETHGLLENYVKVTCNLRWVNSYITDFRSKPMTGPRVLHLTRMLRLQTGQAGMLATLATKLRITKQTPDTARSGEKNRVHGQAPERPWASRVA